MLHSLVVTNMKSEQVLVPQAYRFSVKITKASFIGALSLFNKNIFNNIFDFLFWYFFVFVDIDLLDIRLKTNEFIPAYIKMFCSGPYVCVEVHNKIDFHNWGHSWVAMFVVDLQVSLWCRFTISRTEDRHTHTHTHTHTLDSKNWCWLPT